MRYKIYFDNHAPIIFTADELINGHLAAMVQINNLAVTHYEIITDTSNMHFNKTF